MEKNNQLPALPSNYVTISQLQERWLKEKQRNLREKEEKEKEKEKEREREKEKEREAENQQLPQQKAQNDDAQPNTSKDRRSDDRRYRGRNRNFKGSSRGASSKEDSVGEAAVVEGIKSENTGNETKSNGSRDDRIRQKRKEKLKKWKSKKKQEREEKMAKGETETQQEKAVVRETQEPLAVSEKMSKTAKVGETETQQEKAEPDPPATVENKRVLVKRYAIKRDLRTENAGLVEKSVNTVEIEGEVKKVTEKSKGTVKIEKNIGDLCLNEESDLSETQNNTYSRRNVDYRTRNRIVDSSYSKHRVRTINRRDSEYKGVNGGFNRRSAGFRNGGYRDNGLSRGSDRSWKDRDSRNEKVWVKKEVAVGTDDD